MEKRISKLIYWTKSHSGYYKKVGMTRSIFTLTILLNTLLVGTLLANQLMQTPVILQNEKKISDRLSRSFFTGTSGNLHKAWVFLTDKGDFTVSEFEVALKNGIERMETRTRHRIIARGAKRAKGVDIPVNQSYIKQIQELGGQKNLVSRWINAVSIVAAPDVFFQIAKLPFVDRIDIVRKLRRPIPNKPISNRSEIITQRIHNSSGEVSFDYGPSFNQVNQLNVPDLHRLGLSGNGVLVALFDTGFDLEHVAFDSLRSKVQNQQNFIQNNIGIGNTRSRVHGTQVLSVIGGYAPGHLIGPAYGASYLLANTESVEFENEIEEDAWIAAMEWADSLGVDIVSSSLTYTDWYDYADMDGETAPITRAATIATERGIVVVNAMGNMGRLAYNKMGAPADGKEVISVGAVDGSRNRAPFSSIGPTFDGRIKPDVMAMGEDVYTVDPISISNYLRSNGTSFSTPLVAGVIALLLEAYPNWKPDDIQKILQDTASRATFPDTLNGYGIVNALGALTTEAQIAMNHFSAESNQNGILLSWTSKLEINLLSYRISRRDLFSQEFQLITTVGVNQDFHGGSLKRYSYVDTTAVAGKSYEYQLEPKAKDGLRLKNTLLDTIIKFVPDNLDAPLATLWPNAPNPFQQSTNIGFDLAIPSRVTLTIYNVLGKKIRVLTDKIYGPGKHNHIWNGRDDGGTILPSGVYLYQMTVGDIKQNGKMLLLR